MKTEKNERPILFSGDMVRAIIDGRKTQTRREIKKIKHPYGHMLTPAEVANEIIHETGAISSPYGKVGDRLWVREKHYEKGEWCMGGWPDAEPCDQYWNGHGKYIYAADSEKPETGYRSWPSIHMKRKASRITLEITNKRVELLNDISDADAWAEGVDMSEALSMPCAEGAVAEYSALWERINGAGSWDLNPWVWVIEFKVLEIKR